MKKILTLFAVIGLVAFSSCEGPEGPPGQNALMPTAFSVNNVNLSRVTNFHYEFGANFSSLLFDDETVLIYRRTGQTNQGAPVWELLPRSINYDNGDVVDYSFDFSREDFLITVVGSFNLAEEPTLINNQTFRVVIVPSDLAASVNKKSYLDVMKASKLNESDIKVIK